MRNDLHFSIGYMIKIENLQMYLEKIIKSENGLVSQADVIIRQMKISRNEIAKPSNPIR